MRIIGHDIHPRLRRRWPGRTANSSGSDALILRRDRLAALASTLSANDIVVVEATGNVAAIAEVIGPYVKQVVIANPKQVRSSRMRRSRRTRLTSRFLNRAASWRGYALISSRRSVD